MSRIDANLATQVADVLRPAQQAQVIRQQDGQAKTLALAGQGTQPGDEEVKEPDLRAATAQLKQVIEASAGRSIEFRLDQQGPTLVVKVVDDHSGETLREIPSKEFMDVARRIHELVGMIFDKRA